MARIQGVSESQASLTTRLAYRFARRRLGKVPEPLTVVAHHPWVARAYGAYEMAFERARLVDRRLKVLAQIKAAALIGCPF